jgi:hypothetical protein
MKPGLLCKGEKIIRVFCVHLWLMEADCPNSQSVSNKKTSREKPGGFD